MERDVEYVYDTMYRAAINYSKNLGLSGSDQSAYIEGYMKSNLFTCLDMLSDNGFELMKESTNRSLARSLN